MQSLPPFCQTQLVGADDIDALGHVSNVRYVRWVQDLARAHSEQLGYSHQRYIKLGAVFVVRRHELDYLRPALAGDSLTMSTWVEGFKAATSKRHTRIVRDSDGAEVLRAVTTWAFVSASDGRPRRIPAELIADFQRPAPAPPAATEKAANAKAKPAAAKKPATTKAKPAAAKKPATAKKPAPQATSIDESIRPFLKWAGGKRQLLPAIVRHLPKRYGRYYEPFAGAAALFFHLNPKRGAVLADTNTRLIRTFKGLRDEPDRVIELLKRYPHDKEFFLQFRHEDIDQKTDPEVAAWLIYLNKTAFNGLYRVNSKNLFNVPFGRYKDPKICDEPRLRACSLALQAVTIEPWDFERAVTDAEAGDLVYFDPPYAPLSNTAYFTKYTSSGFDDADQERLRDKALELSQRGVHVLVSNSSAPLIKNLYRAAFKLVELPARRNINSKSDARGAITELLIVSREIDGK